MLARSFAKISRSSARTGARECRSTRRRVAVMTMGLEKDAMEVVMMTMAQAVVVAIMAEVATVVVGTIRGWYFQAVQSI
jgi:hypothetical protein